MNMMGAVLARLREFHLEAHPGETVRCFHNLAARQPGILIKEITQRLDDICDI